MDLIRILSDGRCRCRRCLDSTRTINTELAQSLLELYDYFPFQISSGYRCSAHNKEVGGVPASNHRLGIAADLIFSKGADSALIEVLRQRFTGIIWYKSKKFIHVDLRESKYFLIIE
jgi:uncharacterized protein YcbK (DUF882 family)